MSAETVTLGIHREKPSEEGSQYVIAKWLPSGTAHTYTRKHVCAVWSDFEWWSELPAPVKPKRFVVEKHCGDGLGAPYAVKDTKFCNMTAAFAIPTREAAQRIADIYEETTP